MLKPEAWTVIACADQRNDHSKKKCRIEFHPNSSSVEQARVGALSSTAVPARFVGFFGTALRSFSDYIAGTSTLTHPKRLNKPRPRGNTGS
jgi:hypothetical protein